MGLLHQESVDVLTTTYGGPGPDGVPLQTRVETQLPGCNVQPVGTTESLGGQHVVTGRWRVSTDAPAPWVQAGSFVRWRGEEYPIEGEPQHFIGGVLDHTEFIIRSQKG